MANNVENLIFEHLRAIRADLVAVRKILQDHGRRLTSLELAVGNLAATEMSHYANTAVRADRTDERLERIERRLELREA
jgi:hypothetical protein